MTEDEKVCGDWIYTEDGRNRRICMLPADHITAKHTDGFMWWDK